MTLSLNDNHTQLALNPLEGINLQELASLPLHTIKDILSIPSARHLIAARRWQMFCDSGAQFKIAPHIDSASFRETIPHNIEGIVNSLNMLNMLERSELVFRPVMALERIYSYRDLRVYPNKSMLLIGSRTEYEIFMALGYGVTPENLKAIDLISYSPWITPGDMHALPYADNSFDVLIMGWVLTYSMSPETVINEVIRVARPGAVVSIGIDCFPKSTDDNKIKFDSNQRPMNIDDMLKLFGKNAGNIYFAHNPQYPDNDIPNFYGHLILTVEVKK